jgi:hypothetical protein
VDEDRIAPFRISLLGFAKTAPNHEGRQARQ